MSKKNYTQYEAYSWKELEDDIYKLSCLIKARVEPDVVICISTGGWIPGRLLKNHLFAKYYSIGCIAYNEEGNFTGRIEIIHDIPNGILLNKKVLVIDEVCETGGTLKNVTDHLNKFEPGCIYSAVLHLKKKAFFKPNFFMHEVENKWILYPWSKV